VKKITTPFSDVDFRERYPSESVRENHVLMSFNADDDALLFREWWDNKRRQLEG
jgi:hypothetical protein